MKLDERRALLAEVRRRLLHRARDMGSSVLTISTGLIDRVIDEILNSQPVVPVPRFSGKLAPDKITKADVAGMTPDLFEDAPSRPARRTKPLADGSHWSAGGFARAKALTPAQRSAIARLGAQAKWEKRRKALDARTFD